VSIRHCVCSSSSQGRFVVKQITSTSRVHHIHRVAFRVEIFVQRQRVFDLPIFRVSGQEPPSERIVVPCAGNTGRGLSRIVRRNYCITQPLVNPTESVFFTICVVAYSSRNVFAGSIFAIRSVGTVVAISVTDASTKTTARIVGVS